MTDSVLVTVAISPQIDGNMTSAPSFPSKRSTTPVSLSLVSLTGSVICKHTAKLLVSEKVASSTAHRLSYKREGDPNVLKVEIGGKSGKTIHHVPIVRVGEGGHWDKIREGKLKDGVLIDGAIISVSYAWLFGCEEGSPVAGIRKRREGAPHLQMQGQGQGQGQGQEQEQGQEEEEEKAISRLVEDMKELGVKKKEEFRRVIRIWGAVKEGAGNNDVETDTFRLLCFSRSYSDESESTSELQATLAWRKSRNIRSIRERYAASIVDCEIGDFEQCYSSGLIGVNSEGGVLVCRKFGRFDIARLGTICGKGHSVRTPMEIFLEYHKFEMEWYYNYLRKASFDSGKVVKGSVVFDFRGISMKQFSKTVLATARTMIDEDSHHYPNSLHEMILINVPSFFAVVWRLMKPIIHPDVIKKISIFGSGTDGKEYIRKIGGAEILLGADLGGRGGAVNGVLRKDALVPFGAFPGYPPSRWDRLGKGEIDDEVDVASQIRRAKQVRSRKHYPPDTTSSKRHGSGSKREGESGEGRKQRSVSAGEMNPYNSPTSLLRKFSTDSPVTTRMRRSTGGEERGERDRGAISCSAQQSPPRQTILFHQPEEKNKLKENYFPGRTNTMKTVTHVTTPKRTETNYKKAEEVQELTRLIAIILIVLIYGVVTRSQTLDQQQ